MKVLQLCRRWLFLDRLVLNTSLADVAPGLLWKRSCSGLSHAGSAWGKAEFYQMSWWPAGPLSFLSGVLPAAPKRLFLSPGQQGWCVCTPGHTSSCGSCPAGTPWQRHLKLWPLTLAPMRAGCNWQQLCSQVPAKIFAAKPICKTQIWEEHLLGSCRHPELWLTSLRSLCLLL